ncbi:MAG: hypothetical protein BAA01_15495 [Bacillus thermozeamaize]|uniref:C4-dicarboxylate ABC transporter substrate-binding protein n=1 Tax=Bacillus thermozeamaize TaxID=230954 RepID=A0A1Y3PHN1_9BACI|nr:MAG: hypothetical protein BAA01_15495 [Bacillus thermozeamaize]
MRGRQIIAKIGLLLCLLSLLWVSACGGGGEPASSQDNSGKDDKNSNGQDGNTYRLTYNLTFPPAANDWEPKYWAAEEYARLVKERTNGRVQIDVFYSNQLVPQNELLDALASGTVDMGGASAYYGQLVPEIDAIWLPFWNKGEEHAMHVMRETEVGKIFEKSLEDYGAKVLFYWPTGMYALMTKEPVQSLKDLKGIKMRLAFGIWKQWYEQMGVAPANVAAAEQYEALLRGTIDGVIYPTYTIETYKFHEVIDYLTVPGFIDPTLCFTMISKAKWDQLPSDIQQILLEVGREMEQKAAEASKKYTENAIQLAEEKGVKVNRLKPEEFEEFRRSAEVVWEEFAKRNSNTQRIVEILKKDLEDWARENPAAKEWEKRWLEQ